MRLPKKLYYAYIPVRRLLPRDINTGCVLPPAILRLSLFSAAYYSFSPPLRRNIDGAETATTGCREALPSISLLPSLPLRCRDYFISAVTDSPHFGNRKSSASFSHFSIHVTNLKLLLYIMKQIPNTEGN